MKDRWDSGTAYEYFMGRWSSLIAQKFIDWLALGSELRWLDIGCGSGALSDVIVKRQRPAQVTAVDQSAGFVKATQQRLGGDISCVVGNALELSFPDSIVDVSVSGLVLNFIPEPNTALAEMKRVTAPGGTVAVYVWDYCGVMEFLNEFWDAAVVLNSAAESLHEKKRFPHSYSQILRQLFDEAAFSDVEVAPIEVVTHFKDFDDYWKPLLGGQGPAPTYVQGLADSERMALKEELLRRLCPGEDGSIELQARAWAAKGYV